MRKLFLITLTISRSIRINFIFLNEIIMQSFVTDDYRTQDSVKKQQRMKGISSKLLSFD